MKIESNKFFLFSTFLFLAFSCKEVRNKIDETHHQLIPFPIEMQMKQFKIEGKDLDIFKNPELLIYDTILFVLDNHYVDGFIRAYDLRTLENVANFGVIGRGPDEFLAPGLLTIDKHINYLWFLDSSSLSFHCLSIDSLLKKTISKTTSKFVIDFKILPIFNYHILKNGNILLTTTSDTAYFSEINSLGEVEKSWGASNYPRFDIEHQIDYNYFYYKNLAYNEELNVAVNTYHFHDKLVRYDFGSNRKEVFMNKGFKVIEPITSPNGNVFNKHKTYSLQIRHNSNYVFASYLGGNSVSVGKIDNLVVNYPEEIHVFDWNGKPVAKLIFPEPIISFDICSEGKIYIYANSAEAPLQIYELNL